MQEHWNHNNHFHSHLLRQIDRPMKIGLDIGCGSGSFTRKLSAYCEEVIGIDSDRHAIEKAKKGTNLARNVRFVHRDFGEMDIAPHSIDLISMIASIHHMELSTSLQKIQQLLRPGGLLLVLGLYREVSFMDLVYSCFSLPIDVVCKFLKNGQLSSPMPYDMKMTSPALSFSDQQQLFQSILPTSRVQRHLLWRYSAIWRKGEPEFEELL
ncbi:MAG: class I SAM-dependent methyltransferase [Bacteroidota bacterium]